MEGIYRAKIEIPKLYLVQQHSNFAILPLTLALEWVVPQRVVIRVPGS